MFTSTCASVNFLSVFCRVHLTTALEEAGRQGLKTPVVDEASTKHFWMSFWVRLIVLVVRVVDFSEGPAEAPKLKDGKTDLCNSRAWLVHETDMLSTSIIGLFYIIASRSWQKCGESVDPWRGDYHGLHHAIAEAESRHPEEVAEVADAAETARNLRWEGMFDVGCFFDVPWDSHERYYNVGSCGIWGSFPGKRSAPDTGFRGQRGISCIAEYAPWLCKLAFLILNVLFSAQ